MYKNKWWIGDSPFKLRYEQYLFNIQTNMDTSGSDMEYTQIRACGYYLTREFSADINRNILIPRGVQVTIYMVKDTR